MNSDANVAKLQELLKLFRTPEYRIDDVHLNNLLSHLRKKENEELLQNEFLSDWITGAISDWNASNQLPHSSIILFLMEAMIVLSRNEAIFTRLNSLNIYEILLSLLKFQSSGSIATLKFSYIKLVRSMLTHDKGINWFMSTSQWEHILKFCLCSNTIYLTRESQETMMELIEKSVNISVEFTKIIISKILSPLNVNNILLGKVVDQSQPFELDESDLYQDIKPTLNLVNIILFDLLQQRNIKLHVILIDDFQLRKCVHHLIGTVHNKDFMYDISQTVLLLEMLDFSMKLEQEQSSEIILPFIQNILNVFKVNLERQYDDNISKLCHAYLSYINVIQGLPEDSVLENYILAIQVFPILLVMNSVKKHLGWQNILASIFNIDCSDMLYFFCNWCSHAISDQKHQTQISTKALLYIVTSKQKYSKKQVTAVFHFLLYLFKELMSCFQNINDYNASTNNIKTILIQILDSLSVYCEELTLEDCEDATQLIDMMVNILKTSGFSVQLLLHNGCYWNEVNYRYWSSKHTNIISKKNTS